MTAAATTCPTAAAPVAVTDYAYDDLDRLIRVTEALPAGEGGNRVTETTYFKDDLVRSFKRAVCTDLVQTYATYTPPRPAPRRRPTTSSAATTQSAASSATGSAAARRSPSPTTCWAVAPRPSTPTTATP